MTKKKSTPLIRKGLDKKAWLARCETAFDKGLTDMEVLTLAQRWIDFVMRLEHTLFSYGQSQGQLVWDFLEQEKNRLADNMNRTLAGDNEAYKAFELLSILSHPCQKCAESVEAWHTRPNYCTHRERSTIDES